MNKEKVSQRGCVYFIKHVNLNPIKIGYSVNESPIQRFRDFLTYAPFGGQILGFINTEDPKKLESLLHSKYSHNRLEGEWFDISEEECYSIIDLYSTLEDIKEKNDFEIAWAKRKSNDIVIFGEKLIAEKENLKDQVMQIYLENKGINKSKLARIGGVSRTCIYNWIKEIENN